jgi:8-oxo-dGTP diphosphatase
MTFTYEHPRPLVAVDCVILSQQERSVLLIKRGKAPFAGEWALPGGMLEMDETIAEAAVRELREETGIAGVELTEIGIYDEPGRDPRGRVISGALGAVLDMRVPAIGADDASEAQWVSFDNPPRLAFDHSKILRDALYLFGLAGS